MINQSKACFSFKTFAFFDATKSHRLAPINRFFQYNVCLALLSGSDLVVVR